MHPIFQLFIKNYARSLSDQPHSAPSLLLSPSPPSSSFASRTCYQFLDLTSFAIAARSQTTGAQPRDGDREKGSGSRREKEKESSRQARISSWPLSGPRSFLTASAGSLAEGLGNESIVKNTRKGRRAREQARAARLRLRRDGRLFCGGFRASRSLSSRAGSTSIARRVGRVRRRERGTGGGGREGGTRKRE